MRQARGIAYDILYENMSVDCVVGDKLRISQIIINFLSNAVKFTSQGEIKLMGGEIVAENGQIAVEKFVSHEPEYYDFILMGLGWNTEQMDERVSDSFLEIQPGEYMRICQLLEKHIYGGETLTVYEERTIRIFLGHLVESVKEKRLFDRIRIHYAQERFPVAKRRG